MVVVLSMFVVLSMVVTIEGETSGEVLTVECHMKMSMQSVAGPEFLR